MNELDMTDKVVLITGGSRGLGKAMAHGFARNGADIAIVSRKLDSCIETAKEIESYGVKRSGVMPLSSIPCGQQYRNSGNDLTTSSTGTPANVSVWIPRPSRSLPGWVATETVTPMLRPK